MISFKIIRFSLRLHRDLCPEVNVLLSDFDMIWVTLVHPSCLNKFLVRHFLFQLKDSA